MILLSPYLLSIFIVEIIILILASIALFWALKISLEYNSQNVNEQQYRLGQKAYLIATIIMFVLAVKLPIFLYFVWTMDTLSLIVPGAMCAAGIVSATPYGASMLGLKIINLFLLTGWLLINHFDIKNPKSPFTKLKFTIFQPLFLLLVIEFILELSHFTRISTKTPVACCSVIFSQNDMTSLPFYQDNKFILGLFVGLFALNLIIGFLKRPFLFGLSCVLFAMSTIYALIRFFSPYIYALPTHMCPFCLLQSDYYYVGYFIYILIFLGILGGWFSLILRFLKQNISKKWYYLSMIANSVLFLLLFAYPLFYYVKNGVWL